jgi:large subunit ribosomal protein L20
MTRVKRGLATSKRHKRLFQETKGYWGQRKNVFKRAQETHLRALAFAYKSRKLIKRDMRSLFITRINAACGEFNLSYNTFMYGLQKAGVVLNRKMLSQIAIADPATFAQLVTVARG